MKEFSAQTGGRYTYVEDVLNLQDLSLAFGSIFSDCNNFIISGCEVSGSSIASGYVYINGKIRYFNGATGISSWPMRIYELNSTENLDYVNGQSKVGRTNYGCAIAAPSSVPASDAVTGAAPQYIEIASTGGLRMKNAFFGAKCLLLQNSAAQTVTGAVTFGGAVTFSGATAFAGAASFNGVSLKTLNGLTSSMSIANTNGSIAITAKSGSFVNIGPAIKENGTALETKYVKRSELQQWVFGNAPTSGMTQTQCDGRYARLTEGFTQFVNVNGNSPARLRNQIGAIDQTTADGRYARLDQFLADMVGTDETKKAYVRNVIGAAAATAIQQPIQDTGWVQLKTSGLAIRQWGRIVSVQGKIYAAAANATLFSIPISFNAPGKDVEFLVSGDGASDTPANYQMRVKIVAGSKNAIVSYCHPSLQNSMVTITLTYMI